MERNWQMSMKTVEECGAKLFETRAFADCSFLVGTECPLKIEAHRIFLAAASEVFEAMLFGDLKEAEMPIPVPDIEAKTFQSMLEYLYTDRMNLTDANELLRLWMVADKYQLVDLAARCVEKLLTSVTTKNVFLILEYAKFLPIRSIIAKCFSVISSIGPESSLWQAPFFELTNGAVMLILEQCPINFPESHLFKVVEGWAQKECDRLGLEHEPTNLRKVSIDALRKIRFMSMTAAEFACGPAQSPLLTTSERFAILFNLANPATAGQTVPLPEGFDSRTVRRSSETFSSPTDTTFEQICSQMRSVSWQFATKSLTERIIKLFKNKQLADCEFLLHSTDTPEIVQAHKLILAMSSPVFQAMFYGEKPEKETPIPLPDVNDYAFHLVVESMYIRTVKFLESDSTLNVWDLSKKYQLPDLGVQCVNALTKFLDSSNVFKIFNHAIHHSEKGLKEACLTLLTKKFPSEGYEDLPLKNLIQILIYDNLNISEVGLFEVVEKWARSEVTRQQLPQEPENLRKVAYGAVLKIRFLGMTHAEFVKGPCLSPLLTQEESVAIMISQQYRNGAVLSLPNGFSKSGAPRRAT